ncbi:MAG TPA: Fic family protein [Acidimicrobiales bacterium]|nr:Fic family protein [Acidimicrobiales bacterium]
MLVAPPPHGALEFVSAANRSALSRRARSGQAIRLSAGIYALGATLPPEDVARHHLYAVIAHHWPGSVLCGKTALAGGVPVDGDVFVAAPEPGRTAPLRLPGITVHPTVGPAPLPGDMALPHGLHLSGLARQIVENVDVAGRPPRFRAGTSAAEDRIDEFARSGGAGRILEVLAELDVIAGSFNHRSVEATRSRLASVLGSFTGDVRSPRLRARISGAPYDEHRVQMLRNLVSELEALAPAPVPADTSSRWKWLPFYEAYFSNFIEGTEFGVDEARRIAVEGHEPADRPDDAHDVVATYRLANDPGDRERVPRAGDDLADILRERHAALMAARPDKRPGLFKEKYNDAGGYQFVDPELVAGTLRTGFEVLNSAMDPLVRAVAMMVLVTEVHPFDDGNGRVARLTVNAELSRAGQARIIIPTVFRNNYLAGLTAVSNGRTGAARSLLSIMEFAQRWTAAVDWGSYDGAHAQVEAAHGFIDSGYAESQGLRLELPRAPDEFPN